MRNRKDWKPGERTRAALLYLCGSRSTRDLAGEFSCSYQTVAAMLRGLGVHLDARRHISAKRIGKPSHRRGAKHRPESIEKMRANRPRITPTLGKRYTEEERRNISAGLARHYSAQRAAGALLSADEKRARASARNRFKTLVRRLVRDKAGEQSEALLGYSAADFRRHIEAQFAPGMSWADRESFHVDHIVPVASFLRRGIADPRVVCALSNLQPLPPAENRRKSDREPT
jgi:hypothetical protein